MCLAIPAMPFVSRMTSHGSSFLGGLLDGSNNDEQRLESINTWLLSSYRGLGAGDNPADLEGKVSACLFLLPHLSSFPDFFLLLFCFLTLQILPTAKLTVKVEPLPIWASEHFDLPLYGKPWLGDSKAELKMLLTFVRDTIRYSTFNIWYWWHNQMCHEGIDSAWDWEHCVLSMSSKVESTKWMVDKKLVELECMMVILLSWSSSTVSNVYTV